MINCAKCKTHISNASTKIFKSKYLCQQCGKTKPAQYMQDEKYQRVWIKVIPDEKVCIKCFDVRDCNYYNTFTDDFMCQGCYEK